MNYESEARKLLKELKDTGQEINKMEIGELLHYLRNLNDTDKLDKLTIISYARRLDYAKK